MQYEFHQIGKILIFTGIIVLILGVVFLLADKIPWLGKPPGDIHIKREKFTVYIPIVSSILLSLLISLLLYFFKK
ncbi:MAG: DUF2905 domain-containing protein [Ignavibacteriaceae bacterium]|nr:DUF2905 domain-containing protein [Ignavibacteriaceae bacterium]